MQHRGWQGRDRGTRGLAAAQLVAGVLAVAAAVLLAQTRGLAGGVAAHTFDFKPETVSYACSGLSAVGAVLVVVLAARSQGSPAWAARAARWLWCALEVALHAAHPFVGVWGDTADPAGFVPDRRRFVYLCAATGLRLAFWAVPRTVAVWSFAFRTRHYRGRAGVFDGDGGGDGVAACLRSAVSRNPVLSALVAVAWPLSYLSWCIYLFERLPSGWLIRDAFWVVSTSVTTLGTSDIVPSTTAGRIVVIVAALCGWAAAAVMFAVTLHSLTQRPPEAAVAAAQLTHTALREAAAVVLQRAWRRSYGTHNRGAALGKRGIPSKASLLAAQRALRSLRWKRDRDLLPFASAGGGGGGGGGGHARHHHHDSGDHRPLVRKKRLSRRFQTKRAALQDIIKTSNLHVLHGHKKRPRAASSSGSSYGSGSYSGRGSGSEGSGGSGSKYRGSGSGSGSGSSSPSYRRAGRLSVDDGDTATGGDTEGRYSYYMGSDSEAQMHPAPSRSPAMSRAAAAPQIDTRALLSDLQEVQRSTAEVETEKIMEKLANLEDILYEIVNTQRLMNGRLDRLEGGEIGLSMDLHKSTALVKKKDSAASKASNKSNKSNKSNASHKSNGSIVSAVTNLFGGGGGEGGEGGYEYGEYTYSPGDGSTTLSSV